MEDLKQQYELAKQWLKANQKLLRRHKGEWIAYSGEKGIIAYGKDASEVMKKAEATGLWHIIKHLNSYSYGGLRRLVPIHFRPLHTDIWEPNMIVSITIKENTKLLEMLVDSGADISTVSLQVGHEIGLERYENEVFDLAAGVNGTV